MDKPRISPTQRKLAAILAADVVGYTRMMGADEAATVHALQSLRTEIFDPVFADYKGEVVKSMGDGWLIEFSSAVAAVNAAMQVQDRLKGRPTIRLRMGIHIGDVTHNEHDLYGDGINIASRLETLAPEGGIMISDAVYSGLDGTLSPSFEAAGEKSLKNIARKITTWVRMPIGFEGIRKDLLQEDANSALPHLSIHPVTTTDGRAEIAEFTHALTADLDTFFGGINWLRTSIASTPPMGSYILRPVLRVQGPRLRLETRLMAPDGGTIWTHKSDGTLESIFDWQDAVVEEIAGNATDLILETETLRINATPDADLAPEQCLLMGMMAWKTFSSESFVTATAFQARAIAAKPDMADAYAEAIIVVCAGRTLGRNAGMQIYIDLLPHWVAAARPLAAGHAILTLAIGIATYLDDRRIAPLNQTVAQVLRLAPFDARLLCFSGWAYLWAGQAKAALECFEKSIRLGKLGPFLVAAYGGASCACVQLGMDRQAIDYADAGLAQSDTYPTLYSTKSAALALLGDTDFARQVMRQYLDLMPDRTLKYWQATNDYGGSDGGLRYFEGLRLAGLPEG